MQCSANGDEINLSSQGDVLKQVGDLSVRQNVLVVDSLTQDSLLGVRLSCAAWVCN